MTGTATKAEHDLAAHWLAAFFSVPAGPSFPLSFQYGERSSTELIASWRAEWTTLPAQPGTSRSVLALTDPESGLECRCEITSFVNYPAVEWVAYFRNTGSAGSPIIANIQALDSSLPLVHEGACCVHYAEGSETHYEGLAAKVSEIQFDNFAPHETRLGNGDTLRLASIEGRSSHGHLPFFNATLDAGGVIGAVGWTGDWAATFEHRGDGLHIRAGMQATHLRLHPGEQIRTPRIALLFWQDDLRHAHNLWRRFILAHHTPHPGGQVLQVPISEAVWGERTAEAQMAKARWINNNDLAVEYFWIDAGWHGDHPYNPRASVADSHWWTSVGNWWPNQATYPQGLEPVGQALKRLGLGFVLWFEPERAHRGTVLTYEHPEWLLGPVGDNYLVNLGDPAARRWVTDTISALIDEGGITVYRQDFNFRPAQYWRSADAKLSPAEHDRVGISEIRHIEGLYAFWDELLARHPGLIIDNCAAGGRRIDLETISRSVPLWRSDVQEALDFDPMAMQTQTHGLSLWVPLSAGCCREPSVYAFRSALGPGMVVWWTGQTLEDGRDLPLDLLRRLHSEEATVRGYFYGDFYPLTPFSTSRATWEVWQFDRADLGEGMVLAFRRAENGEVSRSLRLHGLVADARYELRSLDGGATVVRSGRDLLDNDLRIEIQDAPGSALFTYKCMD